jgi:hypothetical protein
VRRPKKGGPIVGHGVFQQWLRLEVRARLSKRGARRERLRHEL